MRPSSFDVVFYVVFLVVVLLLTTFYSYVVSLRWTEAERRLMERAELNLAHLLQMLDQPDMRWLMREHGHRQYLFLEFSDYLKEDVLKLARLRRLYLTSPLFAGIFFLSYYLLRLKARLFCGRNDLRFLSGLSIALFRKAEVA